MWMIMKIMMIIEKEGKEVYDNEIDVNEDKEGVIEKGNEKKRD